MTKYLFTLAVAVFGLLLRPLPVLADPKSDLVDKYYKRSFGAYADGTGAKFVWADLITEVPVSDRDELFASIIDRGANDPHGEAVAFVLSGLGGSRGPQCTWSPHLEQAVLAQAKNKNPDVRALIVDALSAHGRDKYRSLCLSYLDDSDKGVQHGAVNAIEFWPDGKAILRKYFEAHRNDPDRADPAGPIERARQLISD